MTAPKPGAELERLAAIKLHEHPEHAPGCYVMHFYCRYKNPDHPQSNTNYGLYMVEADQVETRTAAIRQIRECGWIYHNDGTATCPLCVKSLHQARAHLLGQSK